MTGEVERAAVVLAEHEWFWNLRDRKTGEGVRIGCAAPDCEWSAERLPGDGATDVWAAHRTHVAEALAAAGLLAESTAEPAAEVGLRAAVEAVADEWERMAGMNETARGKATKVAGYYRRHAHQLRAALAEHAPQGGEAPGVRGGQEGGA